MLSEYIIDGVLDIKKIKDICPYSKQTIYSYIKSNNMEKVGPGIYILPDALEDEVYTLSRRCPDGVISHDDALYIHGLVDREPTTHCITIYSGYNPTRLTRSGYKVYTVKKELLNLGKITTKTYFGHDIPIYNLERTICDLIRSRNNIEIQDFQTALKYYINRKDKDLNLLMKYAKAFHVDKVIKRYFEVLL